MLNPVKHLEVFLYDKSPDSRALTNFWVTLRKETQAFASLDDHQAQFLRCRGIMDGNQPHYSFKVGQKGVLENYFEVHSLSRARTWLPECPRPGVASGFAIASSSAANKRGSSSSHSLAPSVRRSFSTKVVHDFKARRRSSSGPNWSNSASISARLIAVLM